MREINQTIRVRSMPNDLIFVRHGESESNVMQKLKKEGKTHPKMEEISYRPDWQQRLTKKGIEQAKITGKWFESEFGSINNFDALYVSSFLRTRETASYLGGDKWIVDDRIIERFRGVHGIEHYEREQINKILELHDASSWYARPDWGESLQDVFQRYRIFQSSIKRHHGGEKVVVVSHGDFIKTARYAIEWMMPEEWHSKYTEQSDTIPNCGVVHYTRINPYNPTDIRKGVNWVRVIDPNGESLDGEWKELNIKRFYSESDLRKSVEVVEPIIKK